MGRLDAFRPSAAELVRHDGDEVTPAVLRVTKHFLDTGHDVVLLSRRNGVPWYVDYPAGRAKSTDGLERFVEHIRSFLPEEDRRRVTISTTHKYKGLEQSAVVVLDAVERSYPLIHPNWVFSRIFGDNIDRIEAEERRLFYVAVTRAQESLAVLTDTARESPYLGDAKRRMSLDTLAWTGLTPVASLGGARLEIRALDAYDVKDMLKDLGYRWNAANRYWYRAVLAEDFSFEVLCQQTWARNGVRIEVYSEAGELLESKRMPR